MANFANSMMIEENTQLKLAHDFVQYTGANIFLTGKAGTGKTTFLHCLKDEMPKRMIVTAPTGVAAINAGGVTLHSFFQLPFGPQILHNNYSTDVSDRQKDINKFTREKVNIIRSLDLLVIDEISMVRADLLDAVDRVLRRYKNKYKPFGGIQLLMIGDLQQLTPVVKEEDWEVLKPYYESPYFYSSNAIRKTGFVCIELQHIFRQSDQRFINLLNKIRDNRLDKDAAGLLNSRYIPEFDTDKEKGYITLTTHNQQANRINLAQMNGIEDPGQIFSAEISGIFPEYAYPNEPELLLKRGAQVMFVKNDASREKRYYNGKIGIITSIEDDLVYVSCPGDDEEIATEAIEWHNYAYTIDETTEEIIETLLGTFKQIPLKPAWAITIHKSQGLTFDKAVIDARSAFAHGQVYVALSRCRTLEGMVLSSRIDTSSLKIDRSVIGFMQEVSANPPDETTLNRLRRDFEQSLLTELNDFSPVFRRLEFINKLVKEHETILLGKPAETCSKTLAEIKTGILDVAVIFARQIRSLLSENPDVEQNSTLQERLIKGCAYYSDKIHDLYDLFFREFILDTDNKAVKKNIKEAVEKLDDEIRYKLTCLETVSEGFAVSSYLSARAKAGLEKAPARKTISTNKKANMEKAEEKPSAKRSIRSTEDVSTTDLLNPGLYSALKQWRYKKSVEMHLPVYLILSGKSMTDIARTLPRNLNQLSIIKGIGEKKLQQFGREISQMVLEYCKKSLID